MIFNSILSLDDKNVGTRRAAFWIWLFPTQLRGTPRPYINKQFSNNRSGLRRCVFILTSQPPVLFTTTCGSNTYEASNLPSNLPSNLTSNLPYKGLFCGSLLSEGSMEALTGG